MIVALLALLFACATGLTSDMRPCDIYGRANTPCVAAHSTVRALYAEFHGPLYQLKRSDGTTMDIFPNAAGYADASAQDAFCASSTQCVMQRIYDQSPMANHLDPAPASNATYGKEDKCPRQFPATPVDATKHAIVLNGTHRVYGAWFEECDGYRNDKTKGIAIGNDEESMYMVTSGKRFNGECCFDYGNAEVDNLDDGDGTMETVYFGNAHWQNNTGFGEGPWVGIDLENGMYYGGSVSAPSNKPLTHQFVTALIKGRSVSMAILGGDATAGELLTMYDGPRPPPAKAGVKPHDGYQPMKKQGAIVLGIGGDNARGAIGVFYEGVMTRGLSTDAADAAVQVNIVAAGYSSTPTTQFSTVVPAITR